MTGWCDAVTTLKTAPPKKCFIPFIPQELTKDCNFYLLMKMSCIQPFLVTIKCYAMSAKHVSSCYHFT